LAGAGVICHMRFALVLIFCVGAFGQTFEAASIKVSDPNLGDRMIPVRGGPGSADPDRIAYTNISLRSMLYYAYGFAGREIVGPAWLGSGKFDIAATAPPGTTKEQFTLMLRNLLAERFHLVVHRESREEQGFNMVIAKNGPKLKNASDADVEAVGKPPVGPPFESATDSKAYSQLARPGMIYPSVPGSDGHAIHLIARAQKLADLARILGGQMGHPVVDKTGLSGLYDFTLEFAMGTLDVANTYAREIPDALEEQLGLKLEPAKISTEILVVDSADKVPTEN
jgi:uncharacterized protein (TIGR03435 family)